MPVDNATLARRLEEVASLLEEQGANPYRVRAYRNAAATLRDLQVAAAEILRTRGRAGLEELPGIGESIARTVRSMVTTGRLPMLERLRGASDPETVLRTIPGIGAKTAEILHEDLGIDSLEALELAAHDGRLASLPGIGRKRLEGIRDLLAARLGRPPARADRSGGGREPPVADLLDVDREYRERASARTLPTIAPRRMNPAGAAWLPVLHTERGGRHFTALYSNTPRAHRLGRTRDWVVLYCDDGGGERLYTVVTARDGPSRGRRMVRGREKDCDLHYRGTGSS